MKRIPKELQGIVAIIILGVVFWIFNNIALVISIILGIIIIVLLYFGFKNYLFENHWGEKEISIIPLILIIFPGYLLFGIGLNYDEYNKTFQKEGIKAISKVGKAIIMLRKPKLYLKKEIKREAKKELRENSGSLISN